MAHRMSSKDCIPGLCNLDTSVWVIAPLGNVISFKTFSPLDDSSVGVPQHLPGTGVHLGIMPGSEAVGCPQESLLCASLCLVLFCWGLPMFVGLVTHLPRPLRGWDKCVSVCLGQLGTPDLCCSWVRPRSTRVFSNVVWPVHLSTVWILEVQF